MYSLTSCECGAKTLLAGNLNKHKILDNHNVTVERVSLKKLKELHTNEKLILEWVPVVKHEKIIAISDESKRKSEKSISPVNSRSARVAKKTKTLTEIYEGGIKQSITCPENINTNVTKPAKQLTLTEISEPDFLNLIPKSNTSDGKESVFELFEIKKNYEEFSRERVKTRLFSCTFRQT